jgi:hypothetical protein
MQPGGRIPGPGAGRSPGVQGTTLPVGQGARYSYDFQSFYKDSSVDSSTLDITVIFSKEWFFSALDVALGQKTNFDDLVKVHTLLKDFGWKGTWYAMTKKGREYVIFKGGVSSRDIFTSSKYLANDAKVMQFAIGGRGVFASAVQSGVWTIVAVACWDTVKFLLTGGDGSDFLAQLTSNAIKAAIGATTAAYVAALVAGAGGVVVLPIIAGVIVCVGVGFGLNYIDDRYGLTEALKAKLNEVEAAMAAYYDETAKAAEERERDWAYWYYWYVEKPLENMLLNAGGF